MSSAKETLDALDIQIAELQKRRDALALSADFIDELEGKIELPIPQLADLIAQWESHKKAKASETVAEEAAEVDKEETPTLDVAVQPTPSTKA